MTRRRWPAPLAALASLRLTVVLFALAMALVFAGTLAQVELGVWEVVNRYFRSVIAWIDLQLFVPRSVAEIPGRLPFPGGYLIGGLLLLNLIAAHVRHFSLAPRRIGVLVLHTGVVLLLVGELVTGQFAEEGTMAIDEGASADHVEDIRSAELVVIDPAPVDHDLVVAIPGRRLASGVTLSDARLPFAIAVTEWMANSRLRRAPAGEAAVATTGAGLDWRAENLAQVRGVDGGAVDAPSAHLALSRDGKALGSWLVSLHLSDPQPVEVDGRRYLIALRFTRTYKPYRVQLIDFRHDTFVGSDRPRNFSSRVRLIDPGRGIDREAVIAMNEPLRHAGETFYQSAFKPDNSGTVLQVVRNPGWLMPYFACGLVGVGMLLHFTLVLVRRPGKAAA